MLRRNGIFPILFVYVVAAAFTIFYFNGTGDSGDSPMHYLFAKYAPKHPELYFDHWAKPLFVLLAVGLGLSLGMLIGLLIGRHLDTLAISEGRAL